MNRILKRFALVATMLMLAAPAVAQQAVSTTTLSAALVADTQTVHLTSVSGLATGSGLFVDREGMSVVSVNTANNTVQVIRGIDGSTSAPHASGATVYTGPVSGTMPGPFVQSDPPISACTATAEVYALRININSGRIWSCVNGAWAMVNNPYPTAVGSMSVVGADIASATTIAPVSQVTGITGSAAIVNITPPPGCANTACTITLIPLDSSTFTTTAAGNIQLASTAVRYKALIMTWNPSTSKWYPSY